MDDVTVFCSNPLSVHRLISICNQFELASGAKVNRGKSKAMFFNPFTVKTDYLKVLGIWFGGARACAKTCEECIAKVRQKLGFWEHCSLSIVGENLVIRCEVLSLLLYVAWAIPYHLSFVEKFAMKNTFDHKSIRKRSAHRILGSLQEKEKVDPVGLFPEQTVKVIRQNVSSPELSNKHQDITWLV
eukprot:g27125.t1